ncbi:hypothetical protein CAEBREN_18906 [Caenorhabditis brenneri]|uniref:WW domain-containing protein n=1 Tax=Caenorhabditis brenneri TaxID=135651 RepID=G0NDJ1_CAEBE|nr:hypothetical protein CAEBREN_18906 [Caenorhabditis brenneri]
MADPASVPEDPSVPEDESLATFGNWRAVASRTRGHVYYYNVRTNKSQWEKPKKWIIHDARLEEKGRIEHELQMTREKERNVKNEVKTALRSEQEKPPSDV